MGNTLASAIANGLSDAISRQTDRPRTLKIATKCIPDFDGLPEHWTKWKTSALNTLIAGGYREVIHDPCHAYSHDTDNEIVYTLLAAATIDGFARHIVAKYDDEKDGYAAWRALVTLFDGKSRMISTAKRLRDKLCTICLYTDSSPDRYIDVFLATYRNLTSHDGHMEEPEAINLFLNNFHDEDYTAWKTAIRLHKDLDLHEHIHEFRERADSITTARGAKKKLSPHLRHLKRSYTMDTANSSDSSVDTSPSKRVRRRKHKARRNHAPTSGFLQVTPNQSGTITIETADWRNRLTPEDRTFVQAYNAKVKHGESTESLGTPTSFTILKPRLTSQQSVNGWTQLHPRLTIPR